MKGKSVTVFAPATVANVAVGFDILGFAIEAVGDRVTVSPTSKPGVEIEKIEGLEGLSLRPEENTAGAPLLQMLKDFQPSGGLKVNIKKGIPLGSGLGGSAASAVAATLAANLVLEQKLSTAQLIDYALIGESVASGARHGDNVVPCLLGGLKLVRSLAPVDVVDLPVPAPLLVVVVHPHLRIDTRMARQVLPPAFKLKEIVTQTANLASLVAGLFKGDLDLIGRSLSDALIEPHRASLLPNFFKAKEAAMEAGALGFSLSGSGPSVFAWTDSQNKAQAIQRAVTAAFQEASLPTNAWISPIFHQGAHHEI